MNDLEADPVARRRKKGKISVEKSQFQKRKNSLRTFVVFSLDNGYW